LLREPVISGGSAGADGLADDLQRMALGAGVPLVLHSTVKLPVNFISNLSPRKSPTASLTTRAT
jgi:hypothetical protein